MTKILFIQISESSFIINDFKILKEKFLVEKQNINLTKGINFFFNVFFYFFTLLFIIPRYKLIYIWFADYHSFFPVLLSKIFNKKVIIVAGGYDVDEIIQNKYPEKLKEKIRRKIVNYSFKNSTKVLAVSNFIYEILKANGINKNVEVLYNGIDINKFDCNQNNTNKKNLIVTIAGGGDFIKEAVRKRHDLFIEIGNEFNRRFSQYNGRFLLIGYNKNSNTYNFLKKFINSDRVELIPKTKNIQELLEFLKNANIYMQLSYHESFGIAQIEAMLNGCIPVSNPGGAIPEVIGDAGILIENFDMEKYIQAIKDVLDGKYEYLREKARQRVIDNFSLQSRKEKLLKIVNELLTQ